MLTPEQIKGNWESIIKIIEDFKDPRKDKILKLYKDFEERIIFLPHSYKPNYVGMYPGGWVKHLLNVYNSVTKLDKLWNELGASSTYSSNELIFSILTYDLYKLGTKEEQMFLKNDNEWEVKNRNLLYKYNDKLQYMSNIDRTILILNEYNIIYSENELLAIRLYAGLNDENNKPYFHSFIPEARPRTSLIYVLSQGIEITDRIMFESEFFPKFYGNNEIKKSISKKPKKQEFKEQVLSKISSNSIKESLKSFL